MLKAGLEMSKSPLKRSGSKRHGSDADRHASKKRKLVTELSATSSQGSNSSPVQTQNETPAIESPAAVKNAKTHDAQSGDEEQGSKKRRRKQKSKLKLKDEQKDKPTKWKAVRESAGRFIHSDPVFLDDEKYLVLATKSAVQLYSTSTSLLVRSLQPAGESSISTFALSASHPTVLYIGTFSGGITKWDWATGKLLATLHGAPELLKLIPAPAEATDDFSEFLYSVNRTGMNKAALSMVRIKKDRTALIQHLFEQEWLSREAYLTCDGKVIVLSAERRLIFGAVHQLTKASGETKFGTFRELTLPEEISSIDVRERNKQESNIKDPALDIVVGSRRGPILVYEDAYGKVLAKERIKEGNVQNDLVPRRMHWHREAVNSARWSRDGNYIISGGKETVLVLWQLDTLQKQFLPHLSAEIHRVTVSPAGMSYSLLLGNNTNIVLATSELRPTASMSGLDLPNTQHQKSRKQGPIPSSVITVNNRRPEEILLATSSMLQTFDTRTLQTLSRQAITRNNITNSKVGPGGTKIHDPAISGISVSRDGTWLATIDEWTPKTQDMEALYPSGSEEHKDQEVYLKLWVFNEEDKTWELNSRVDKPHSEDSTTSGFVFKIVANPSRLEFATVGDDGFLKVWAPRTRTRDGQPVKNKSGRRLVDWFCRYALDLKDSSDSRVINAALSFSEDGSLITAKFTTEDDQSKNPIKLIDNTSGTVSTELSNISSHCHHLVIVGSHLISLTSTQVEVFDLVRMNPIYTIPINLLTTASSPPQSTTYLTSNSTSQTFALAFPLEPKHGRIPQTQFAIFTPDQAKPVHQTIFSSHITALLSDPSMGSYILIDEDAVIRRIQSPATLKSTSISTATTALPEPEMKLGLADMFGQGSSSNSKNKTIPSSNPTSTTELLEPFPDNETSLLRSTTSSLFAATPKDQTGLTPVSTLFERLAMSLLGKKEKDGES